jgi:hypothetical protein
MRSLAVLLAAVVLPVLAATDRPAKALKPAEAAGYVNKKVTVEMEVKSSGGKGPWFLNSEADFKDAKNFTAFLPRETLAKFKQARIDDPAAHFRGKTIRVTGTVTLYRERPQIRVEEPGQIRVVDKQTATTDPFEMAKVQVVRVELRTLDQALAAYFVKHKEYPKDWKPLTEGATPYLERVPLDPWKKPYQYAPAGKRNGGKKPDVWTVTPSRQVIGNWPEETKKGPSEAAPGG